MGGTSSARQGGSEHLARLQHGSASRDVEEEEEGEVRGKEGETGCKEEDKWQEEIISRQRASTLLPMPPAL